MSSFDSPVSRRKWLANCVGGFAGMSTGALLPGQIGPTVDHDKDQALIAITLDLEMSRHYPTWDQEEWDYEKGNLNAPAKQYAVQAAEQVKALGGVIHFFSLGRVFEQQSVEWLEGIVRAGHPVGNHTYDHVNVKATEPDQIQFRFRRAPWLMRGKPPSEVITDNIRMTTEAMNTRLGIDPVGFRTPGGFADGLSDRPDIQKLMLSLGFDWVSSKYPNHPIGETGEEPSTKVYDGILAAQAAAQPFAYPSGLIEIPMSPVSDVFAFRTGRWELPSFLKAIRMGVEWAIENRTVYDFLSHPSCLYVTDPKMEVFDLICNLVKKAGDRAVLVSLDTIAERVKSRSTP
jgi:peptidoglycan/xylan/chitin deacetylase (PgdA/CDA1 family)